MLGQREREDNKNTSVEGGRGDSEAQHEAQREERGLSALCFLPLKIKDLCLINVQTSVSSPVGFSFPCAAIEKGAPEDSGLFIRLAAVD